MVASIENPSRSADPAQNVDIIFQGFNWDCCKYKGDQGNWYKKLITQIPDFVKLGVTIVWLPPPTDSLSPQGYLPRDIDVLDSAYGSKNDLKELVTKLKENGITALADTVLNHRCASHKSSNGQWTKFGGRFDWDDRAVICNDPHFQGRGHQGTGVPIDIAPNIDHRQQFVQESYICWMRDILKGEIGFNGWRIDYARGFSGEFVGKYIEASDPYLAVGEFWDGLAYDGDYLRPNQEAHRNRIAKWIDSTGKRAMAFDFTLKGILMTAVSKWEFWRLKDRQGRPTGLLGSWPDRAVTFIDNHDTGSSQQHWPWPSDKVMMGYAYILTHPGVPTIFYDHPFDWKLYDQIAKLVNLRKKLILTKLSTVNIEKADGEGYIARITSVVEPSNQVYLKLGNANWAPSKERGWVSEVSGNSWCVWSRSSIPQPVKLVEENVIPKEVPESVPEPPAVAALKRVQSIKEVTDKKLRKENFSVKLVPSDKPGKVKLVAEYELDDKLAKAMELKVEIKAKIGSVESTISEHVKP